MTDSPTTPEREAVARIIDPAAFRTVREIAALAGLDAANPPVGVILRDDIDAPIGNRQKARAAALAKADAILARGCPEGEPVAWRMRANRLHPIVNGDPFPWRLTDYAPAVPEGCERAWFDIEPLYAAPQPSGGE